MIEASPEIDEFIPSIVDTIQYDYYFSQNRKFPCNTCRPVAMLVDGDEFFCRGCEAKDIERWIILLFTIFVQIQSSPYS